MGNNEANQLSRGEIFLNFFASHFMLVFKGAYFYSLFLHSKRQILRTSPKIFVLFLIDFAMLIVERPKRIEDKFGRHHLIVICILGTHQPVSVFIFVALFVLNPSGCMGLR